MISITKLILLASVLAQVESFSMNKPLALSSSVASLKQNVMVAKMSEQPEGGKDADGNVYDDETPQYKDPISDNMRARLLKEASTGLDSEQKQTNVILYICIAIAALVALGGEGILY